MTTIEDIERQISFLRDSLSAVEMQLAKIKDTKPCPLEKGEAVEVRVTAGSFESFLNTANREKTVYGRVSVEGNDVVFRQAWGSGALDAARKLVEACGGSD